MKTSDIPIRNTGRTKRPFLVDFRSVGGRRESYISKAEAETAREFKLRELKRHGSEALTLSHCDRIDLVQATDRVEKLGATLAQVIDFYEKNHKVIDPILFSEAIKRFVAAKQAANLDHVYVRKLKAHLEGLQGHTGDKQLGTVTQDEIEKWLFKSEYAPATVRNIRIDVRTFFKYATERHWIKQNPAQPILRVKIPDSVPGILTVPESEILMRAALKVRTALPVVVLNLFCGLRPEEAVRLSSANIHVARGFVEVPAAVAKSRQRRIVQIPENAKAWLKLADEVIPRSPKWYARQIPKLQLEAIKMGTKLPWPKNCLRHSFASYHLAEHGSADKTATEMGHRSTDMLFRHYRELVTKDDAAKFWNIRPIALVEKKEAKAPALKAKSL